MFLTIILFLFLGFWLLSVIGRLSLRWWIAKKQREFQEQFGGGGAAGGTGDRSRRKRRREGEVTVTRTVRQSEYQVRKGVGDYVEYEEITSETTTTYEA